MNKPKLMTVNGMVRNENIGFTMALTSPRIKAKIKAGLNPSTETPLSGRMYFAKTKAETAFISRLRIKFIVRVLRFYDWKGTKKNFDIF